MSACHACADFARDRLSGSYRALCLECQARSIANSPLYFAAVEAEALTPAYRAALQKAFGGTWKAWHSRIKHYAAIIKGGGIE